MSRPEGAPAWLVLGAGGQLGSDLLLALSGSDVRGLTRADADLTVPGAVERELAGWASARPDRRLLVVNAAAWTDVDGAESAREAAYAMNARMPRRLAASCRDLGAGLVHVSTDYVFAGRGNAAHDEDDPVAPVNAYGASKAAGEEAVLAEHPAAYVVRTSWVYGGHGRNFVRTMVGLERSRALVQAVDDQWGAPTWSRQLAGGLVLLAASGAAPGRYHWTNSGVTSWYGLATAVFEEIGADPGRVLPVPAREFSRPAARPANSRLGNRRWRAAGLPEPPPWRSALGAAFATVGDRLRHALG